MSPRNKLKNNTSTTQLSLFQRIRWDRVALIALLALSLFYALYASYFTILRMHTLYANHFDLGIMNQTVYNTYRALTTGDLSRILLLTDPHTDLQIYRPAIHNDILLALLAPFYFLHPGPETLLVIQSVALASGAIALYLMIQSLFSGQFSRWYIFGFTIGFVYLIYPAVNFTNFFDFHAVALATPLLLFMFYFWLEKKYRLSLIFAILAMFTKEQVPLTTGAFAAWVFCFDWFQSRRPRFHWFSISLLTISIIWFALSIGVIAPQFRTDDQHFMLDYYEDLGDSPGSIVTGIITRPEVLQQYLMKENTGEYIYNLFMPLGFTPFLAPYILAISGPEFAIILLSNNANMRNIYFHYTAVLIPVIFISTIYAVYCVSMLLKKRYGEKPVYAVSIVLLITGMYGAYTIGPLPFAQRANIHPFRYKPSSIKQVYQWQEILKDESISVSTTGKLGPFFSSRTHYYMLSPAYVQSQYVVVNTYEVYNSFGRERAGPGYEQLVADPDYELIFNENGIEVYKRK